MAPTETDDDDMLQVVIRPDPDLECPADHDNAWRLYSFNSNHSSYKHPSELRLGLSILPDGTPEAPKTLQRKIEAGLAFWVSYFEHGDSLWFRMNTPAPAGVEFQFDGRRIAGIVVWEHKLSDLGAETYEERARDVDYFLRDYTAWVNGDCQCWYLEDQNGEVVDSGSGQYQMDALMEDLAYALVGRRYRCPDDWSGEQMLDLAYEVQRMRDVQAARENSAATT